MATLPISELKEHINDRLLRQCFIHNINDIPYDRLNQIFLQLYVTDKSNEDTYKIVENMIKASVNIYKIFKTNIQCSVKKFQYV